MRISKEVRDALINHKPVVALESTIISHGMPYPRNVETALRVEQEIINNASNIYDLYRDDNYISLSYFLEDVINNNLEDVINKKNKTL